MTDERKTQSDDAIKADSVKTGKDLPTAEEKRLYNPPLNELTCLAEAGGSVSGRLYATDKEGKLVAELQYTARGLTARHAIDNFMDGILYGKKFNLSLHEPLPPQAPATIPPTQALYQPPQSPTSPAQPPPPINPPMTPTSPAQPITAGGTIHATKIGIEIRSDGRANLSFYATGHRYADLSTVRSVEDALALLAPCGGFTPAHIVHGASYTINALIDWQPGKLNKNNKPYKDIVAIRAA